MAKRNKAPKRRQAYRFSDDFDPMVPRVAELLRDDPRSVNAIAEDAGVSWATVARFEQSDVRYPRNSTVTAIMRAMNIERVSYDSSKYASIIEAAQARQIKSDPLREAATQAMAAMQTIDRIRERVKK